MYFQSKDHRYDQGIHDLAMSPATTAAAESAAEPKRFRFKPLELSGHQVGGVFVLFAVIITFACMAQCGHVETIMIKFARELEQNFGKGTTTAAQNAIMEKLSAHRRDVVHQLITNIFWLLFGWVVVGAVFAAPHIINFIVNDFVLGRLALVYIDDKAEAAPVPGPAQPAKDAPAHEDDAPGGSLGAATGDD